MQAAHHTATGPLMLALRRVVHPYEAQYQGMKHLPRLQNDHSQPRHPSIRARSTCQGSRFVTLIQGTFPATRCSRRRPCIHGRCRWGRSRGRAHQAAGRCQGRRCRSVRRCQWRGRRWVPLSVGIQPVVAWSERVLTPLTIASRSFARSSRGLVRGDHVNGHLILIGLKLG